jgi:hypothetical protein
MLGTPPNKFASWPGMFRDFTLGAMGIACLGIAIYSTIADKLQAGALLFSAGLILIAFSSLSRFESIKALGIEAKMVALNDKLSEADDLLAHMRNMVGLMADTSFQIIGNMGRWDAEIPKLEMIKIVENFEQLLVALGEPEEPIQQKLEPWHQANTRDMAQSILGALNKFQQYQNQVLAEEARSRTSPLADPSEDSRRFDRNTEFIRRANEIWEGDFDNFPDEVEKLISETDIAEPAQLRWLLREVNPMLKELRHYLKHKKFKDRNGWLARPYFHEIQLDFTSIQYAK